MTRFKSILLCVGIVVSTVTAAGAATRARAERRPAGKETADRVFPPIVRLAVLPSEITVDGPHACQHLLIMGTRANGAQADLTGQARLVSSAPTIASTEGWSIMAQRDGKAIVTARYQNLTAQANVTIKNTGRAIAYSFRNDVVPTFARIGCSQGTCHGANSGKGGFKLSLRGYAPELDWVAITRLSAGRRIAREAPAQSLLLRKPLMEVRHGGGKMIEKGSRVYYTLLGWIMQGAPNADEQDAKVVSLAALPGDRLFKPQEHQRLVIQATFSNGRVEDVTDRAVFRSNDVNIVAVSADGEVVALNPGATAVQAKYQDQLAVHRVTVPFPQKSNPSAFAPITNYVDTAVYAKLRELNLEPSGTCTDEEFVRRAYLDVLGILPTADEARQFLDSRDADKRSQLIDGVLKRPEYASVWALKLCDLSMVRKEHMQRKNTVAINQWLTEQFQQNRPWDQFVTELLTATGSIVDNPATLWWASRQSTRPNARGWVRHYQLTGEIVAQLFLGQPIQCAKCHNHPTERYTQDDYYRFAALFAQVNGDGPTNPVPARFVATDPGEVRHPRTGQVVTPMPLDRANLNLLPGEDRRVKFAQWLTGPGRDLFARNLVNRVWARLFGAGIVEPVDDLRVTNPPRNEALLAVLTNDFIAHKYDVKYLMATIMRSRTYQSSSTATPNNRVDTQFCSHYPVRRLPAEELMDAVAQVTGVPDKFATYPLGTRAIELSDTELPELMLDTFGRPNRTTPCECDRSASPTMSQALALFNGERLQTKLKQPDGAVAQLLKSEASNEKLVEELFLRALSRRPSATELVSALKTLTAAPNRDEGAEDVMWALINTKEFMFNH